MPSRWDCLAGAGHRLLRPDACDSGTSSGAGARTLRRLRQRQLRQVWQSLQPAVRQLALQSGAEGAPSWDDFLWAYSVFW